MIGVDIKKEIYDDPALPGRKKNILSENESFITSASVGGKERIFVEAIKII